jgi:hypothetical protein
MEKISLGLEEQKNTDSKYPYILQCEAEKAV